MASRGKRKVLTCDQKKTVIKLYEEKVKQTEIAKLFDVSKSTVCCIIRRYQHRGNVENRRRSGRPNSLTVRSQHALIRQVKKNRSKPLSEVTCEFNQFRDQPVSRRTVQRVLYKAGYHRRVVRKKIRIRYQNKRNRVAWCRSKMYLSTTGYWDRVIFSDESKVEVGLDNRVYIWRKIGEDWQPACTAPPPRKKFGVMLWGCITCNGVGTLAFVEGNINAEKYIDILEDNLWPVVARHFPQNDYIFQDDNAPVHRARTVIEYKLKNKIKTLTWPAQSPDLNIIENVWFRLKKELHNDANNINSVAELKDAIRAIWEKLPVEYIKSLYKTIPRRIRTVLRANGNVTKY